MRNQKNFKEKILEILISKREPVSGQEISSKMGVSRAAVWKYIETLRDEGYRIDGVSNRGYKLVVSPDLLNPSEIKPYLPPDFSAEIYWSRSIDSTNEKAKELARAGAANGTLVVAETQLRGRGRRGREWQSPPGGIWFSVILRPQVSALQASRVSIFAAVVVAEEIAAATGVRAAIKWPNDILVDDKKVCGILIELAAELEQISYIVVGIGINANISTRQLSPDVSETATTLMEATGKKINRQRLLAKIAGRLINELPGIFGDGYRDYLERWRRLSAVLGRQVRIEDSGKTFMGKAVDIEENGALAVELDSGKRRIFESGEVSLRIDDKY